MVYPNYYTTRIYKIESLNNEIRRIIVDEEHFTESDCPIQKKSNFSSVGSIVQLSPQGSIISFVFDDIIRILLGFHEIILYKEYNLSANPVDISSFDKIFLETDVARAMIFKGKRSGIFHNFTMTANPGNKKSWILFRGYYLVYDGN